MAAHRARWRSPEPYWQDQPDAGADPRFAAPAMLRFADDEFMEKLLAIMDEEPARLAEFQVRHETWRDFLPEPAAPADFRLPKSQLLRSLVRTKLAAHPSARTVVAKPADLAPYRLKLYQPAHQRHYLVMTSLVCEAFGFPDRNIDAGRREEAGFVLRRLFPRSATALDPTKRLPVLDPVDFDASGINGAWAEHAFVPGPEGGAWLPVAEVGKRVAGEEMLPLFPLGYLARAARRRRLLGGVLPVGKREAYMGAARDPTAGETAASGNALGMPGDPRCFLFLAQVIEPWKRLIGQAAKAKLVREDPDTDPMPDREKNSAIQASRDQTQAVSWYVLLDLAKLLETHLPAVWDVIVGKAAATSLSPRGQELIARLRAAALNPNLAAALAATGLPCAADLCEALQAIRGVTALDGRGAALIEEGLEQIDTPYAGATPDPQWPRFLFPLADCEFPAPLPIVDSVQRGQIVCPDDPNEVDWADKRIEELTRAIDATLAENPLPGTIVPKTPAAARAGVDPREGWFVIRCCYERPECGPRCTVMSAPTAPFQLAGFFDPDAPARPIRIGLPIDTTPAGLRKFDKNTAIAVSDVLCGQVTRLKALTFADLVRSVLPWPLHKDLDVGGGGPCKSADSSLQLGMICSLSIPIITICALILLMIMVSLLDIIFRWMPYFFICFPIPGLKAKEKD